MSDTAALLVEIGCEEIPPRMIPAATADLERRLTEALDRAGLDHGASLAWGGSRRLAVRVESVQARQEDRDEEMLGPPAAIAFTADGEPTRAASGFASKQGIAPHDLERIETDKGVYAGFRRRVRGRHVGEVLEEALPALVSTMSFPKTMRWGDGKPRWVRPVHWLVALHGGSVLPVALFGICADSSSAGHRFLGPARVTVSDPSSYERALESAFVVVDPADRRRRLGEALHAAADSLGGVLVEDEGLLEEVADIVEWPGVVAGRFDRSFLELPRELLITTLRHHQKCFAVQSTDGELLPGFLAVANTDRDPGGHVRRGNEWVVVGRLEDARFFWNEDRKRTLADRAGELADVVFHAKVGTFADKGERMDRIAGALAEALALGSGAVEACRRAARMAKIDLVTSTVGEFPELQGRVGGLLLEAEGADRAVADAVYGHYQPQGPHDPIPATEEGAVVSLADKLDTLAELLAIGEKPTGSRDPFGLRRAASGVFRVVIERGWPVSLDGLGALAGVGDAAREFLRRHLENFLREGGATPNEIMAVLRPRVSATEAQGWPLPDVVARLHAIRAVRERPDFEHLVDLTKRVDNILSKDSEGTGSVLEHPPTDYVEEQTPALELEALTERLGGEVDTRAEAGDYARVVDLLAELVRPVERFFDEVLVMDPERPDATSYRCHLLAKLRSVLTRCFDVRELAGQADRRSS